MDDQSSEQHEGEREAGEKPADPVLKSGVSAREAGRLGAAARARKAAERREAAEEAKLTVRQRLGLALAEELTVEEWRAVIRRLVESGKSTDVQAIARLADQAYGRARESAEGDDVEGERLSREEAAAMLAELRARMAQDGVPSGDETDPRDEG